MAEGILQEEIDLNFEKRIYEAFLPMERNTLYAKGVGEFRYDITEERHPT